MRALLHQAWPGLAFHFKVYPDDIPRFSRPEWNSYVDALEDIARANQQQTKGR